MFGCLFREVGLLDFKTLKLIIKIVFRFGPDYLDDVVERTNVIYGALKPQTTNVLYVHGSIDPWHALGLTDSNDSHIPTIFIEGTAHCANMYEPSSSDFPQLIKAREQIQNYIANLLK